MLGDAASRARHPDAPALATLPWSRWAFAEWARPLLARVAIAAARVEIDVVDRAAELGLRAVDPARVRGLLDELETWIDRPGADRDDAPRGPAPRADFAHLDRRSASRRRTADRVRQAAFRAAAAVWAAAIAAGPDRGDDPYASRVRGAELAILHAVSARQAARHARAGDAVDRHAQLRGQAAADRRRAALAWSRVAGARGRARARGVVDRGPAWAARAAALDDRARQRDAEAAAIAIPDLPTFEDDLADVIDALAAPVVAWWLGRERG